MEFEFTNLLIVAAIALPAVVLEIVAGIVIGPAGLSLSGSAR